jgi:tRNA dimethylallyltransferase
MKKVPRVIVVAGPTASGKSALALCLAEALNGVIINGDSLQCYRDLPKLTARPSSADEKRAVHKLYGTLAPTDMLSATAWAAQAGEEIVRASAQGKQPIVAGGTGFYLKALMEGLADIPPVPAEVRLATQELLAAIGPQALHDKLKVRDPATAARLKPTDKQRIARAWEVFEATETPLSTWQSQSTTPPLEASFTALLVQPPRAALYGACDARFLTMLEKGALAEVKALLAEGVPDAAPVMRALGARELAVHLAGALSLAEATDQAQAATRQYAKRQTTWFRHQFRADYVIETKFSESLFDNFFPEIRRLLLT